MAKYKTGDMIIKQDPNWGETIALVTGTDTATNTFPDQVEYYKLLIIKQPVDDYSNLNIELATWLVDKTYNIIQ